MSFYGDVRTINKRPDGGVDYNEAVRNIVNELEQFANLPLSTSWNNEVNCFSGKYVSNGLNLYYIVFERSIWVKQIKNNPNVAVSYMSRQIRGKARILGNPYRPKYDWLVDKFKIRHLHYIEALKNFSGITVIEVVPTFITIFEVTKDHPLDWTAVHIDIEKEKAFWTCAWDSPMMSPP